MAPSEVQSHFSCNDLQDYSIDHYSVFLSLSASLPQPFSFFTLLSLSFSAFFFFLPFFLSLFLTASLPQPFSFFTHLSLSLSLCFSPSAFFFFYPSLSLSDSNTCKGCFFLNANRSNFQILWFQIAVTCLLSLGWAMNLREGKFWMQNWLVDWLFGFYGISTFVGYLMLNPFLCKYFYFKQFCLVRVHSLIVKNISISNYSNSANFVYT